MRRNFREWFWVVTCVLTLPAACGGGDDDGDGAAAETEHHRCVFNRQTYWTCSDMDLSPDDAWDCWDDGGCPASESSTDCDPEIGCCSTTRYLSQTEQPGTCADWQQAGAPPPGSESGGAGGGGGGETGGEEAPPPECTGNADCARDAECQSGSCVQVCGPNSALSRDAARCDCDAGFIAADDGYGCVPGCTSHDECAPDEACQAGACVQVCGVNAHRVGDTQCGCDDGYEWAGEPPVTDCKLIEAPPP